ncbi:MAG TPA: 16S rRNA (uracil(1498)-N(3))-methyltransferase [Acidimicrobiia bacterium]|nr:16S rRNA (uracil(1498)-N(3))-methyltransferase [Acidimicrobiia bacterium]
MGHVPHLYLPGPWQGPELALGDDHEHHLTRVLRMSPGAEVSYTDGEGTAGRGILGRGVVERDDESSGSLGPAVEVAVAPPDSRQRARFVVEKLVELGVRRLIWVRTRRTEGRPPPEEKARAWAVSALEQSRGTRLMAITRSHLDDLDPGRLVVVHPGPDPFSLAGPRPESPILLVGPEGGLDEAEIPPGAPRLALGSTILRVETAALAATVSWYALHGPDRSR